MQLLPKSLAQTLPKLYESEWLPNPEKIAYAKLFHPAMSWSWYILEYDGKDECFGLVVGTETEFGYFSLKELEAAEWYGVGVERDLQFRPTQLQDLPVYGIERVAA